MKNYFEVGEHACSCGCGGTWDENFLFTMNEIREEAGVPMKISSGFRCTEYDTHIGGKGVHPTGKAADVLCSGRAAHRILRAAVKLGVMGIGVSQKGEHSKRFIHLDMTEGETRPFVWSY